MSLTPRLDKLDFNYIMNGGLDFWQRSLDATGDNIYVADRFKCRAVDANAAISRNARVQRITVDVPSVNGIVASAMISTTTANTTRIGFGQFVEQKVAKDLANKDVTVSFYVKRISTEAAGIRLKMSVSSLATPDSVTGRFVSDAGIELENEAQVFNSLSTSLWTRMTYTFTATGAMAVNGFLMAIRVEGAGTPNLTNLTNGDIFKIAGVMIQEAGEVRDFVRAAPTYIDEFAMCQRYYEKSYNIDTILGSAPNFSGAIGSFVLAGFTRANVRLNVDFKVQKRATPTVGLYSPQSGTFGTVYESSSATSVTAAFTEVNQNNLQASITAGGTVAATDWARYHYFADADF